MTRAVAGAFLLLSSIVFAIALGLPTVTFDRLASGEETYSILGGVGSLWEGRNKYLAPIVFVFSIVWPIGKLVLLGLVWAGCGSAEWRWRTVRWLRQFGKWSLLDFFIVGAFVGSIKLGVLSSAESRVGIHVFTAAILLSMVSVILVNRMHGLETRLGGRDWERVHWWGGRSLSIVALVLLVAVCLLPLVEVQKALIFRNSVRLPATSLRLARDGEVLLAAGVVLFVMVLPLVRASMHVWLRWAPRPSRRVVHATLFLDEWTMLDVFALGLVVVFVKLDELAKATPELGFWLVLVAAVLGQMDAWSLRRSLGYEPGAEST